MKNLLEKLFGLKKSETNSESKETKKNILPEDEEENVFFSETPLSMYERRDIVEDRFMTWEKIPAMDTEYWKEDKNQKNTDSVSPEDRFADENGEIVDLESMNAVRSDDADLDAAFNAFFEDDAAAESSVSEPAVSAKNGAEISEDDTDNFVPLDKQSDSNVSEEYADDFASLEEQAGNIIPEEVVADRKSNQ